MSADTVAKMKENSAILVTGGAGFIGSSFVLQARKRWPARPLIVLDSLTYAADPKQIQGIEGVDLIQGDIRDGDLIRKILDDHHIEAVVHFAAESHVDRSIEGPAAFLETNVFGTFQLLEAARKVWADDKGCRFLHVSTDEVFGSLGVEGAFHEESPYAPNSPYSASKASSDHLVRAYYKTYGLPGIVTNCSNNYGPRQHAEKLIPKAILSMAQLRPVPLYGDGLHVRDWLYVEDHCDALMRILEAGSPGDRFCIGGNTESSNRELLQKIAALVDPFLGRELGTSERMIAPAPDRLGHDRRYAIDASHLTKRLGWKPNTDLEAGLIKTVEWYLHPSRSPVLDGKA
jgi:dTDP-glucose 4,6-dehydratase